ncbi:MAG TPA: GIY-YIG nuclease family protein [Negativicutes bacterium]|nr:GIY-YIG nuclease family protein [Negativicutes bacterium]
MEKISVKIQESINFLPRTPGVYLFWEGGEILYIGKAINIKERVKNHFMQPVFKDKIFIPRVTRIEARETGSEIDALLLEANLIKQRLPKFNAIWKDDKNYFYVAISKNTEKLPYVHITHQKNEFTAEYIGPFIEGAPLKKILKYLRRVFPHYTQARHPKNACTWCHLGLCPGAAPDVITYKKDIKKLVLILQGKRGSALRELKSEMAVLAKDKKFEEAGKVRDRMLALDRIMQHTHVIESQNAKFKNQNWPTTEKSLQEIIGVKTPISKIECYDISNIQGKFSVGSMVVFVDGAPDKSQYKKFRIRMENEPNDIAMLREVFQRRLAHPEWGYPQVMLIDGGKAQLNAAINSKSQTTNYKQNPNSKNIKIISIAKGKQELLIERKPKIPLKALPQEIYNLVKHLDDEAHRFAKDYHTKVRKRAILQES